MRISTFGSRSIPFKACPPTPNESHTVIVTKPNPYITAFRLRSAAGRVPDGIFGPSEQIPINLSVDWSVVDRFVCPPRTDADQDRESEQIPTYGYWSGGILGSGPVRVRAWPLYLQIPNKFVNPPEPGMHYPSDKDEPYGTPTPRTTPKRNQNPLRLGNDNPHPNLIQTEDGASVRYTNNPTTLDRRIANPKKTRTRYAPSGGSYDLESVRVEFAFDAGPNIVPMNTEQHPSIYYTLFVLVRKWAVSPDGMRMDPNNSQTEEFVHDGVVSAMLGAVSPTKYPNKSRKLLWWAKRETRLNRTRTARGNIVTRVRLNWVPNNILPTEFRTDAGNIGQTAVRHMVGEVTIPERRAIYTLTKAERSLLARIDTERKAFNRMKAEHRKAIVRLTIAQTNTKPRLDLLDGGFGIHKGTWDTLTDTQQQVCRLVMDGKDYRTISEQVFGRTDPKKVTRTLDELRLIGHRLVRQAK